MMPFGAHIVCDPRSGPCIASICRGIECSVHDRGKACTFRRQVRHSPGSFILFAAISVALRQVSGQNWQPCTRTMRQKPCSFPFFFTGEAVPANCKTVYHPHVRQLPSRHHAGHKKRLPVYFLPVHIRHKKDAAHISDVTPSPAVKAGD